MNRFVLVTGAVAVLFGSIVIVEPGVLARVGVSLPSTFIIIIGLIALFEAFRSGYSRFARSVDAPSVPEPERRSVVSVPGTDFDTRLAAISRRTRTRSVRERSQIRDRLTETAIEVLVRYDGDTPEYARERLQTGSWTDDPAAAAFFTSTDGFQVPLTERLRMTVTGDDAFCQQARRAIAVLADRTERTNEQ